MLTDYNDLCCYKQIQIDSHNNLRFFLEKHSTKEGTWGLLTLLSGEINFIFLNGEDGELSRHRVNANESIKIPPAAWHKIESVSESFAATLKFYCHPHRYFNKKYGLGNVHSDLYYVFSTYLQSKQRLNILDVGCGQGRNLLFLALLGHQVTGIDINEMSIQKIRDIAQKESELNVKTILHDLDDPLSSQQGNYDIVISLVSLQFLKPHRVHTLLTELQQMTVVDGLHFLVFPLKSESYSLPDFFTYLPETKELYHFYQNSGWSILEYTESVGQLHKVDEFGKPIQGLFGLLLAQKVQVE